MRDPPLPGSNATSTAKAASVSSGLIANFAVLFDYQGLTHFQYQINATSDALSGEQSATDETEAH